MGWSDELAAAAPASAPTSWADELAASKNAPAPAAAKASGAPIDMGHLLTHPIQTLAQWYANGQLDPQDFAAAAAHHIMAPLHGAASLVENGLSSAASVLPDNPVSRYLKDQTQADNQATTQGESSYQKNTPNTPSAYMGAATGSVAPFLLTAPAEGLNALGNAAASKIAPYLPAAMRNVGSKVVSGATQGATVGAVQPVTNPTTPSLSDLVTGNQPESYWSQKGGQVGTGAAVGGILPALESGVQSVYQGGKNFFSSLVDPTSYAAKNISTQLGDQAPQVISDLQNAQAYVPGSTPTAAQAAGTPKLVMMEKSLANANPAFKEKLLALENSNNAARLQAVGNVAQTPQALADAIASRNAATAPMRDFTVTNGNPVPVGGIQDALSSLADGSLGVRPTIGGAANSMRSAVDDFTNVTPPNTLMNQPGSATANPAMLDALRQNTNDYLSKYAPGGFAGTQEQAAMTPIKSKIIDAIDAANRRRAPGMGGWGQGLEQAGPTAPGYRDYLTSFAQKSVPVNTMEVGQQLQKTLLDKNLNSAGDPAATLANYRGALARALNGSDYAIDPSAQKALEAVQSDLQRATISNSVRSPGSDTAYNQGAGKAFLKALGAESGGNLGPMAAGAATTAATGSVNAGVAAGLGVKKGAGLVANRVGNAMGDLFLDPKELAKQLQTLSQATSTPVPALLARLNSPGALAALLMSQSNGSLTPAEVQR